MRRQDRFLRATPPTAIFVLVKKKFLNRLRQKKRYRVRRYYATIRKVCTVAGSRVGTKVALRGWRHTIIAKEKRI